MSKLSPPTMQLLRLIKEHPLTDGVTLRERFNLGTQTGNNLKLLEQYEYIRYDYTSEDEAGHHEGWILTQKGEDVLKYG